MLDRVAKRDGVATKAVTGSTLNKAFTALKRFVGPILANHKTGAIIAKLFKNRIPHRGLIIDTNDHVVGNDIKAALFVHGYESSEYRFVRKYLPRDSDVVELGGSLGVISCTIRRHIDAERKLVIVEADPRLAALLSRNLKLNDCECNSIVEHKAISYSGDPTVSFGLGETSVSGRIAEHGAGLDTVEVEATTLSKLLQTHNLKDYCLVSDIEGVEWQIVAHDFEALANARVIVMETHDVAEYGKFQKLIEHITASGIFDHVDLHGAVAVFVRRITESSLRLS